MYMATGEFFGEWSPLTCPDARMRSLQGQAHVLETVAKELKEGEVAGAYSYPLGKLMFTASEYKPHALMVVLARHSLSSPRKRG